MRRPPAVQVAIEKKESEYIHLECDHYTTHEEDILYSNWRTVGQKGKFYCDKCGRWRKRFPKPRKPKITQEPLF